MGEPQNSAVLAQELRITAAPYCRPIHDADLRNRTVIAPPKLERNRGKSAPCTHAGMDLLTVNP
jgi:hypothetical protein